MRPPGRHLASSSELELGAEEPAPAASAFVDARFAMECRLKGFKPKQEGNFTGSCETGAGGAVKCPPLVGADGARDFRGEERSTARRSWSYDGPSVQAHLLFRCETERRVLVAVSRDVGNSQWMAQLSMTAQMKATAPS